MLSVLLAAPDDPGEAAAGLPELLHALSVVNARMAAEAAIAVERMNALRLMASLSLLSVGLSDVEAVIRGGDVIALARVRPDAITAGSSSVAARPVCAPTAGSSQAVRQRSRRCSSRRRLRR